MKKLVLGCFLVVLTAVSSGLCQTTHKVNTWNFAELNGQIVPANDTSVNPGFLQGGSVVTVDSELGVPVLEILDPSGEMQVPYSADLEPATGTIQLWVKVDHLQDADLVSKWATGIYGVTFNLSAYVINIDIDGRVRATLVTGSRQRVNYNMLASHTGTVVPNRWTLITLTWGGGRGSLYVDGVRRQSLTYKSDTGSLAYQGQTALNFASRTAMYAPYTQQTEFAGRIAMPKLFNYALTDTEVSQEYVAVMGGGTATKGRK